MENSSFSSVSVSSYSKKETDENGVVNIMSKEYSLKLEACVNPEDDSDAIKKAIDGVEEWLSKAKDILTDKT